MAWSFSITVSPPNHGIRGAHAFGPSASSNTWMCFLMSRTSRLCTSLFRDYALAETDAHRASAGIDS
jgi:hypothetical protein